MNAREILGRGRAAGAWLIAWRWSPVIGVAILAALLVQRLDAGRRAASEAARLSEAAALQAQGQVVAALKSQANLRRDVRELAADNEDLAAALRKAEKASKGVRPVVVVSASTGPVSAAGAVRPSSPPPGEVAPAPAAGCLLATGDKGEIRADSALLQTKAGNLVFVGAASAWRVEPGPPARLFGGQLMAKVSAEVPGRPAGWGVGARVGLGPGAWVVGGVVGAPPVRVWRWQLEALGDVGVNPGSSDWQAGASVVLRRWR